MEHVKGVVTFRAAGLLTSILWYIGTQTTNGVVEGSPPKVGLDVAATRSVYEILGLFEC